MGKVTIKDIAKKSGVSEATVSRALNNNPAVKQETILHVLRVARELGYRSSYFLGMQPNSQSRAVGIILPDIVNPFFANLVDATMESLASRGYYGVVFISGLRTAMDLDSLKAFTELGICGLIAAPYSYRDMDCIRDVASDQLPLVFSVVPSNDPSIPSVSIDHEKAMFRGAEYLIALGHKKIHFIGGENTNIVIGERIQGFLNALDANNIPRDSCKIISTNMTRIAGYNATKELIKDGDLPTAIISTSDYIAFGIMEALTQSNIKIPEDISILGFDNVDTSSYGSIGLTTINQPYSEIGPISASMLIGLLENKDILDDKVMSLDSSLIIRNTCKRLL